MEKDKESINILVNHLNKFFFFRSQPYQCAIKDDCYILENYKKDVIEEKALIHFLRKSIICPSLRLLMPDILYYTHELSVSDRVFLICCRYPGKYRETLLNLLAHMALTQKQLEKLLELSEIPEAVCRLFILLVGNEKLPSCDFVLFLKKYENYWRNLNLEGLIKEKDVHICSDKYIVLKQFLKSGNDFLS